MSLTTTYAITLGLESPELTVEDCKLLAYQLAGQCFPSGHTIQHAVGRWESPERGLIDEPSLIITVIGQGSAHDDAVRKFVSAYKNQAAQDCVLVQVTRPDTFWI